MWIVPLGLALMPMTLIQAQEISIGDSVRNFVLESSAGENVALCRAENDLRGTVIAFTSVDCPISKVYLPRLVELHSMYAPEGFRFLAINPNVQDSKESILEKSQSAGVEFPVLLDPYHRVTDYLGVQRTTEVFVLDSEFKLVYRGAIDDQYGIGAQKDSPSEEYVSTALECILGEVDVEISQTEAPGCLVGRLEDFKGDRSVTFHLDVAPILFENCVECHRDGQIGPMTLFDYKKVRGWGKMIVEVVDNGRMPPWHANPLYGEFKNHRGLSETDKAVLRHWVEAGAPEGDPDDAPDKPVFVDQGWSIGEPDLVIELPEDEVIPATGTIPYRYVQVDPQIDEDRWVQAMEIRPTAPDVTHHVLVLLIPKGKGLAEVLSGGSDFVETGYFAVQVPGCRPNVYPEGTAKFFPAGSKLLFQMHYTANGEETVDRTKMAFRWAKEPVERRIETLGVANTRLNIPPGKKTTFTAEYEVKVPMQLVSMFPHMHSRGFAFRIELVSGGKKRVLLDVPKYDFNWQNFYHLSHHRVVGKGDQLICTATFDNSEDNPFNPDPEKRVFWGDQTWEEMMIGYMDFIPMLQ